jgi:hypothetical protein
MRQPRRSAAWSKRQLCSNRAWLSATDWMTPLKEVAGDTSRKASRRSNCRAAG